MSTEYCTIGSQPGMDGCVRCDRVCTVWTEGVSECAMGELVVVEVGAVMGGVVWVFVKIGKAGGVIAILVMLTVSVVWRTALKVRSTWFVR